MDKAQIKASLKEIAAERKVLDARERALKDLLATYEAGTPSTRRRVPGKVREQQVLDLLRSAPTRTFDNRAVADEVPMPYTTATRVMVRLAVAKQVTVVGDMPDVMARVAPAIKHKAVRIVPGKKAA